VFDRPTPHAETVLSAWFACFNAAQQ